MSAEISGIAQIAICVRDMDRAIEFYRDKLGLRLLFSSAGTSFFDCGGVRVAIERVDEPVPRPDPIVSFRVERIETSARQLQSRGVIFDRGPHLLAHLPHADLWTALFHDDDHNLLALLSEASEER